MTKYQKECVFVETKEDAWQGSTLESGRNEMLIRKLDKHEHGKTRKLYETVFFEDTKEFVDYYYTWKTKDNTIYVAEDEDGIHAMIHLNPFDVWVSGQVQKLHYIVAVATEEIYRHQGLMSRLLEAVEKEMADRGEAFTFLMPASEKIYAPFGYRYFAGQRSGILGSSVIGVDSFLGPGQDSDKKESGQKKRQDINEIVAAEILIPEQYICRPVEKGEYQKLADFVNCVLQQQYDVFVWRDAAYYERLCAEQRCQNGDVMVVVRTAEDGTEEFAGTFCTAREGEGSEEKRDVPLSIRELILSPEHSETAVQELRTFCSDEECKVEGSNCTGIFADEMWKPMLMGKVPAGDFQLIKNENQRKEAHKETAGEFSGCLKEKRVFINEVV